MFKKFLRNQSGFSLIQGMILATAVAGMAYVGTKMTTDQKMLQKTADANSRVDQLHKIIYSVLQNKENCARTFFQNGVIPIGYSCSNSGVDVQSKCFALGGSPGAMHIIGQGACYLPGGPGPDTVCLTFTEAGSGSCGSYMLCHGLQSLTGTKNFLAGVWSGDSAAALFKTNPSYADPGNYDPSVIYMNNSVSIVSMDLTYPPDLTTADATLKILYGKLESKNMDIRSGKGYGGNRIAKDISIKIQRHPITKAYDSCYAVTGSSNDTLHKDFCDGLGYNGLGGGEKLFSWDAASNTCKLNLKCADGEVFTGWDSNGTKLCKTLASQMDLNSLLAGGLSCDLRTVKNVKFTVSGGKIQIDCAASGGSTPCSTSCDCSSSFDVCVKGLCTNRMTGCLTGEVAKGDKSCQWYCNSGGWTCKAPATPCGSTTTACSSSCDCPNSFDVCVKGVCTDRTTGCLTGEVAKGDNSCQWTCNSGGWTCKAGSTACGAAIEACCPSTGLMVSNCSTCPMSVGPNLCTSMMTLQCAL